MADTPQPQQPPRPDQPNPIDTSKSGQRVVMGMLTPDDLTPEEKARLEEYKWDGETSVPLDLAKRIPDLDPRSDAQKKSAMEALAKQTEAEMMAADPIYKPPTTDLQVKYPDEVADDSPELAEAMSSFKPELLSQFGKLVQKTAENTKPPAAAPSQDTQISQAIQAAEAELNDPYKGLHPEVQAAAQEIDRAGDMEPEAQLAAIEDHEQGGQKQDPEVEKAVKQKEERQRRFKTRIEQLMETVPKEDQEEYKNAFLTFSPYQKQYTILGQINITFRETTHEIEQMIAAQTAIDITQKRFDPTNQVGANREYNWYLLAAQLVGIHYNGSDPFLYVPLDTTMENFLAGQNLASYDMPNVTPQDTDIRRWSLSLRKTFLKGPALSTVLLLSNEFQTLVRDLRALAVSENFSKAQS